YFDELRGESHLRYVPNTDHSLDGSDAFDTLLAFHREIVEGTRRPEFSWSFDGEPSIVVRTRPPAVPEVVRLWQAWNAEARDFPLTSIRPAWRRTTLEPQTSGVYRATVERPVVGWTAFFIELAYPSAPHEWLKL